MAEQRSYTGSFDNRWKFTGKELDEDTGLYYYGARFYNPSTSIWLSVDPLVEQTMDAYGYCYQNPINLIDPTGMSAESLDNEYKVYVKDGKVQHVEYISNKGGDKIDYITEIDLDQIPRSDAIQEYTIEIDIEYTSGPSNTYLREQEKNPTPGYRKVHGKTHTDLLAYEWLLSLFTGGQNKTASSILGMAAKKQVFKFTKDGLLNKMSKAKDKMGGNQRANKQFNDVVKTMKINDRDSFSDFLHKEKLRLGKGGADNFSWDDLKKLAKNYKKNGGN